MYSIGKRERKGGEPLSGELPGYLKTWVEKQDPRRVE